MRFLLFCAILVFSFSGHHRAQAQEGALGREIVIYPQEFEALQSTDSQIRTRMEKIVYRRVRDARGQERKLFFRDIFRSNQWGDLSMSFRIGLLATFGSKATLLTPWTIEFTRNVFVGQSDQDKYLAVPLLQKLLEIYAKNAKRNKWLAGKVFKMWMDAHAHSDSQSLRNMIEGVIIVYFHKRFDDATQSLEWLEENLLKRLDEHKLNSSQAYFWANHFVQVNPDEYRLVADYGLLDLLDPADRKSLERRCRNASMAASRALGQSLSE